MDERVPVIVGVGQVSNKDPSRVVHPGDLLETTAQQALGEAGSAVVDTIGAVYASPISVFSDMSGSEIVAERLGLASGLRVVDPGYSGTGPLTLLDHACRAITAGRIDAALIVGGVADASVKRAQMRGEKPPAPPGMPLSLGSEAEPVGMPFRTPGHDQTTAEAAAGVAVPAAFFALAESQIAEVGNEKWDAHREMLGKLLASFSEVAAGHPDLAWFSTVRQAAEIAAVSPDNRFIAEPYTKLMCSFPTVDLAAAVVVTSSGLADRIGIPAELRVRPWGIATCQEPLPMSRRREIHRSRVLDLAVERLLSVTAVNPEALDAFDFYSCFPAAVQIAAHAFDLDPLDPRRLTVTGGMPYFGGPGASYGLHGIACMIEHCRSHRGSIGAVVGLGGMMEKFAIGLFSSEASERSFVSEHCGDLAGQLAGDDVKIRDIHEGEGTVFAGTVLHNRATGPVAAPAIVDLPDGTRAGARAASRDVAADVSGNTPVGRRVRVFATDGHCLYEPV
jgi:acetyl-CoA C-acetyltransferase